MLKQTYDQNCSAPETSTSWYGSTLTSSSHRDTFPSLICQIINSQCELFNWCFDWRSLAVCNPLVYTYSIRSTWSCYWLDQFLTLALNILILSIFYISMDLSTNYFAHFSGCWASFACICHYPRMLCHVFWSQVEYKIVCFITVHVTIYLGVLGKGWTIIFLPGGGGFPFW